jgi:two-component system NtrC family sensor kinase
MRILIVEDNRDHQYIIRKKIQEYREGAAVDTVQTVDEAQSLIEQKTYGAILLDYRLQGSSGMELMKWLRERDINVPVIMITNMEDVSLAVQAVKLGAYDYLCKNRESFDRLPLLIDKATEEFGLKRKLRETEFRYRTLVEGINEAVFLLNGECEILYISSSVERLFGCSEEECRKDFRALFTERGWQQLRKKCHAVVDGSRVDPFVLMMRHRNGTTLMAEINASRMEGKDTAAGVIGTIQDVTKRVLLERELNAEREETRKVNAKLRRAITDLKRAQEQLVQSEKLAAIGQLVSGVAHELNNPLFSAMGNTELLIMDGMGSADDRSKLEKILDAVNRARLIVRELIQFSRGETFEKEVLSVNDLLRRTVKRMDYEMKLQNLSIKTDLQENLPPFMGSSVGLQRVFINILKNASQAFEENGIGGVIKIRSYHDHKKGDIHVEIANNGPEIPQEHLSSIFDPFFTTRDVGKGTGLGLSTAYGIVKEHGGDLTVRSSHEWTTFTLRLAALSEPAVELKPLPEKVQEEQSPPIGETVLLVESEPIIRNLLSDFFRKKGFTVKTAASGEQALHILTRGRVSSLVVDDRLTDMRGTSLLEKVGSRKEKATDRILLIVDNGTPERIEQSAGSGFQVIRKPFSFDELLEAAMKK